jgi:hypothetical protein
MGDSMSTIINATTTNGVVIQPDNSGSLVLQTNSGTTALTIDTSQNVGIGTTSPATKLQVSGASGSLNTRINAGNTGLDITPNDATGVTDLATTPLGGGGKVMTFTTYTGSASSERMRIDSSGNVGIGQSSPRNRLTVNGAISGLNASATASSNTTLFTTGTTAAYMIYATWNNGGGYAVIIAQGNISGTAVLIASSNAVGGNNAFDVTNNFASNSGNGISIFPNGGALNLQIKQNYTGTANVFVNIFGM